MLHNDIQVKTGNFVSQKYGHPDKDQERGCSNKERKKEKILCKSSCNYHPNLRPMGHIINKHWSMLKHKDIGQGKFSRTGLSYHTRNPAVLDTC